MNTRQIVDEYFIENRTKLLDLAAFLDRLDRSADGRDPWADFRMEAFRRAVLVLTKPAVSRVQEIQMIFSDPTTEPKTVLDKKSASGAYEPAEEVR